MVQGVGGAGFQTAGILKYVEDLKAGTNTRIGPKNFFEIASIVHGRPPALIVQYVEPDFLDSLEGFPKNEVKKIKIYLRALVAHIEKSETVEDLKAINLSEFSLYLLSKRAHDDLTLKLLKSPEIEPSRIPSLYYLSGRSTEKQFPNRDLYLYKFDAYKLFFCLRGQVCTLLRVERNALS